MYSHTSLEPIPTLAEGKSNTSSACSASNLTHPDVHGYQGPIFPSTAENTRLFFVLSVAEGDRGWDPRLRYKEQPKDNDSEKAYNGR